MANKRMAGEELDKDSPSAQGARTAVERREKRESLQTNDAARERRIDRMKFGDGLTELPDGFDSKKVAEAMRGSWGDDDLNRYNKLMGGGSDNTDPIDEIEDPTSSPDTEPPGNGGPTQTIDPPGLMPGIPTGDGGGINFRQNQDNDQTITNNGSNNTNNQYADNSNTLSTGGGYTGGSEGFSKEWMNKYFNFGA